ncbi:hypothetical protein CROQUDRAFT_699286 [Cronartium quercuum f. sp. fusiforme G11]|uniref:Uncharacterized protein n=1 Tax=Cronartium quercuum f. sp. fusiforme G11 TaxID=708437 RepID=A0A9P6TD59_9BASI|nr:hypothetical protein CROQUDRAFT_699286 [Cronartium quercuum f. sp. fusiforme G11]
METIAKLWEHSKADCINLKDQAQLYLGEKCESTSFLLSIQLHLPSNLQTNQPKMFAIKILQLLPMLVGSEAYFWQWVQPRPKAKGQ